MDETSSMKQQNTPNTQNTPNVKQGWADLKTKLSQKFDKVTGNDIEAFQRRDRNALVGYIHGRVGGDRTMVERDIDALARETNYRFD